MPVADRRVSRLTIVFALLGAALIGWLSGSNFDALRGWMSQFAGEVAMPVDVAETPPDGATAAPDGATADSDAATDDVAATGSTAQPSARERQLLSMLRAEADAKRDQQADTDRQQQEAAAAEKRRQAADAKRKQTADAERKAKAEQERKQREQAAEARRKREAEAEAEKKRKEREERERREAEAERRRQAAAREQAEREAAEAAAQRLAVLAADPFISPFLETDPDFIRRVDEGFAQDPASFAELVFRLRDADPPRARAIERILDTADPALLQEYKAELQQLENDAARRSASSVREDPLERARREARQMLEQDPDVAPFVAEDPNFIAGTNRVFERDPDRFASRVVELRKSDPARARAVERVIAFANPELKDRYEKVLKALLRQRGQ